MTEEFKGEFECIEKNMEKYITFSIPIKKKVIKKIVIIVKQLRTNQSLLIILDLCQLHYQIMLITYLKLTKKNAKHAWIEKILNQSAISLAKKIIIYILNVKNVKEYGWNLYYHVLLIAYLKLTKKECKACMERKNIKWECDFIGIKNNQLS